MSVYNRCTMSVSSLKLQTQAGGSRYSLEEPAVGAVSPRRHSPQVVLYVVRLFITLLDGSVQVLPDLLQHLVWPLLR